MSYNYPISSKMESAVCHTTTRFSSKMESAVCHTTTRFSSKGKVLYVIQLPDSVVKGKCCMSYNYPIQ